MYQTTIDSNETEFNKLVEAFNNTVTDSIEFEPINEEYDLTKRYTPIHACIWNNPTLIGQTCVITEKNDKIVVVNWIESDIVLKENPTLLQSIYRLEDLVNKRKNNGKCR